MISSRREMVLAVLAGTCVLGLLLHSLVLGPIAERWKAANETRRNLRDALEQAETMAARLPAARRDWRAMRDRLREEGSDAFVGHIRDAAVAAKLSPRDIRYVKVEGREALRELIFEMKVTCEYEPLLRFLWEVGRLPRPIRVAALSVRPDARRKDELNVDVRLAALVLAEEKQP